ncbi:BCCT family transporter [Arenicella xantha]|uniref:Choline/glycine/proline betaine transport protein n=1 Tax=Arenicella xantha TaxID=644221 RepID=A0A395JIQ9_9GAMM|nr:BCCT family transporter [Arenicella xantha]RBP50666.1 choline/glycine/proline betaine transport protein [Arenicella xantha]
MSDNNATSQSTRFSVDRPVFYTSIIALLALVAYAGLMPKQSGEFFSLLQSGIVTYASWYYVMVVAIILVCVLVLGFSRAGDIKLGLDHSQPEYSNLSWFAMLFSAGMGIGLMFFGVAEPVMHFMSPPRGDGNTVAAAREAMRLTFFHWGLHAWSIYAIVALILGYFSHRHGLPLTLRSALYPLIGERIYGRWGTTIDVFAILGTTCGIATSLGLGVIQINSGLDHLFGIEISKATQVLLIIGTMGLATVSVLMGLDAGIKRLSELNMTLAAILLAIIVLVGPTVFIFQTFMQNIGDYLSEIVSKTFNLYAYDPTDWLGGWTILYWGWWLSWAPFVGLFIARISKGRTIREFVFGAMLVPCVFNLFWFSAFGNSAIDLILSGTMPELGAAVQENQAVALFGFLESFPMSSVLAFIALLMVVVFFVTSADSGAMVLNMLASKGEDNTSAWQRVIWTVMIGLITVVLLYAGGLSALQTASIAGALPFSLALLWAIYGFFKAVRIDVAKRDVEASMQPAAMASGESAWRDRLDRLLHYPDTAKVSTFQTSVVLPAMTEFVSELKAHGIEASVTDRVAQEGKVALEVNHEQEINFVYEVICVSSAVPKVGEVTDTEDLDETYSQAEVHLSEGGQGYDIMGWSKDSVVSDIVSRYENHLYFIDGIS